ncbi:unnamed protein product [Lactuca saligna]|uniref:Transposase (putative) gypsy type domain-containing protein n=1 Tax=Lactuca saligna TaxID=75948 RepID=A0AA35ZRC6_LACSI|nr:unnamed protein product [Lactuca saligna]
MVYSQTRGGPLLIAYAVDRAISPFFGGFIKKKGSYYRRIGIFSVSICICSEQGVQIPLPDASLYSPPKGKVIILIALFEAGLRFPTTYFFNLIIREYGFSVRELTPIAIKTIMGFELLCHALSLLPTVPTFKYFFNASTQSRTWTLSRRWGLPTLIHDKKSKKIWHEKFLWVNNDLVVLSYPRTKAYVDRSPTLFGADKELAGVLEKININGKDWLDCFLATGEMRAA